MAEDVRVLRLELNRVAGGISGRLSDATGWQTAFTGWIGLAAAIEAATTLAPAALSGMREETGRSDSGNLGVNPS